MTTSLKNQIKAAFPKLTDNDFSRHDSDLYVIDQDGSIRKWLKENYEFYTNVTTFIGNGPSWEGKRCLDIPFAAFDEYMLTRVAPVLLTK